MLSNITVCFCVFGTILQEFLEPKISFCRHVGISSESVKCFVDQLDPLLQCPVNNDSDDVCGTGEEQHNDVIQKYDELCKLLRNLKDLPLSINSIQGSAPVFRYSEVSVQGHLWLKLADSWLLNVSFYALPSRFTSLIQIMKEKKMFIYILQFILCKDACCFHVARQMYIVT